MKEITQFIIKIAISLFKMRNIVKIIETSNISYYSYEMRELAMTKFNVETYDLLMGVIVSLFMVYMIWVKPKLIGKAKKLHIMLQVTFHILIFFLVIYECGFMDKDYIKMFAILGLYILVEVVLYIFESIIKNKESKKEEIEPMK